MGNFWALWLIFFPYLLCKELDWILGTHVSLIQFQFNSYLIKIKVAREELWFMTTPYFCNRYLSPAPPAMQCKKAIARGICTPWQEWGRQMGHLLHLQKITFQFFGTLVESFYYVNYVSSIIMSKVRQIISVMKT